MWDVVASMWTFIVLNQAVKPPCGLLNKPAILDSAVVQAFQVGEKSEKKEKSLPGFRNTTGDSDPDLTPFGP